MIHIKIRQGVFETNSSNVHSVVLTDRREMSQFESGELMYDPWEKKFVPTEDGQKYNKDSGEQVFMSYEDLNQFIWDSGFQWIRQGVTYRDLDLILFGFQGYDG